MKAYNKAKFHFINIFYKFAYNTYNIHNNIFKLNIK